MATPVAVRPNDRRSFIGRVSARSRAVVCDLRTTWLKRLLKRPVSAVTRRRLPVLFGWANEHLVDRDVSLARDDIDDRVGDVRRLQSSFCRDEGPNLCLDLGAVVALQFGLDVTGLDQRDADVALGDLLAQRLAERVDGPLGCVVRAGAGARDPAGDRADVDQVRDPARLTFG